MLKRLCQLWIRLKLLLPKLAGRTCKRVFTTPQVHKEDPLLFLPERYCVGKSRKHLSIGQKLSEIPLTRAHRRCTPSFWQERLALRTVDKTCQISPTRRYTRSWYTATSILKKWLQALTPFLSQFPFILNLCLHFLNFLTRLYISRSLEPAKACS